MLQKILQSILWRKKIELMGSVKLFSVDYRSINTNEILDIHKYLIKELL